MTTKKTLNNHERRIRRLQHKKTSASSGGGAGPAGPKGDTGDKGDTGEGVPAGGTVGQILAKVDSVDFNTEWVAAGSGGSSDFVSLTDTPANFTGASLKYVRVNTGETALEYITPPTITTTFVGLTDTPANFTGQGAKLVAVNSGETALEFIDLPIAEASGDEYYSSVVALVHFEGTDASTTVIDDSEYARTLTTGGNAQLDTAQFKFGTASGLFDGTGDNVSMPDAAELTLADTDFTIECFVRFNGAPSGSQAIMSQYSNAGSSRAWYFRWQSSSNELLFSYTLNGLTNAGAAYFAWTPSADTWYHVALCRDGSNLRCFVDGAQVGSTFDISTDSIFNSSAVPMIGALYSSGITQVFNGWIDELRWTIGTARYTANFTAPTDVFPDRGVFDDAFITLNDTPSSYTGQAGKAPVVNSGETALEFIDTIASSIEVQTTNATETTLYSIALADGEAVALEMFGIAIEPANEQSLAFKVLASASRTGATTRLNGRIVDIAVNAAETPGPQDWVVDVDIDDTTDVLRVRVTGEASTTIDWQGNYITIVRS